MKLVTFEDFVNVANFFYLTIGIEPYEKGTVSNCRAFIISLTFYVGVINLNIVLIGEIVYVIIAVIKQENFLESTMAMSYIGFVVMGDFKMLYIYKQREVLTRFVNGMQEIFPNTADLQVDYNTMYYSRLCSRIAMSFSILYMFAIWTYNLFSVMQYFLYDVLLKTREMERSLPYFTYSPVDWHTHWSYYLLYASQNLAGYTSAVGQISADLFFTACATQLIMHYDFVSTKFHGYKVNSDSTGGFIKDLTFISDTVQYHDNLFELTNQLNTIFGKPLLLNFVASTFIMCFVGFQMTIGADPDVIAKLLLFLVLSVTQLYMICYYGEQMIEASTQIAHAAYEQDWTGADVRYMKLLVLIIARSQKAAQLKATTFVLISKETMTKVMQLSYKFFALLRTIYTDE